MPISCQRATRPPVAFEKPLTTSNLPDIHIYDLYQFIVLQQVLGPASGVSTADICMYSSFFFQLFHTSQSQTKRPTFGPAFKHQHSSVPSKGTKNPQLQNCIPCVPPEIHSRTVNRFLCCRMLQQHRSILVSVVCDYCSQSSEYRIVDRSTTQGTQAINVLLFLVSDGTISASAAYSAFWSLIIIATQSSIRGDNRSFPTRNQR
jgi:hypothetical protein